MRSTARRHGGRPASEGSGAVARARRASSKFGTTKSILRARREPTEIAGGDTAEPLSVMKRTAILRQHLPDSARRVLDGGCGSGGYVRAIRSDIGVAAVGVEFQAEKLACAPPDVRDALIRGDLEHLGLRDNHLDAVLLNEVLEHVPSDQEALREAYRVLRPGGTLVVMSPNRQYPFESHGVRLRRTGGRVPVFTPFIPYVPMPIGRRIFTYWARNYWPWELQRLVEGAGFRIQRTGYVWQTFEGISGEQPRLLRRLVPVVRTISDTLERAPVIRRLGVSQLIVAIRP